MNSCDQQTTHHSYFPKLRSDCFSSSMGFVQDHPDLKAHWDLTQCFAATSSPHRLLIWNRSREIALVQCCNMLLPTNHGDDYVLLEYLPVAQYAKTRNFRKEKFYDVSCIVPQRYNLEPFKNGFQAIIVDVELKTVLVSGSARKLTSFMNGMLDFEIDVARGTSVSYDEFIRMIDGESLDEPKPVETMRDAIEQSIENDGFIRLI